MENINITDFINDKRFVENIDTLREINEKDYYGYAVTVPTKSFNGMKSNGNGGVCYKGNKTKSFKKGGRAEVKQEKENV